MCHPGYAGIFPWFLPGIKEGVVTRASALGSAAINAVRSMVQLVPKGRRGENDACRKHTEIRRGMQDVEAGTVPSDDAMMMHMMTTGGHT
jgi:hypothetical protein